VFYILKENLETKKQILPTQQDKHKLQTPWAWVKNSSQRT